MPAAFPSSVPAIPTAALIAQLRQALRAIVVEKGFVEEDHGKQPFVTERSVMRSRPKPIANTTSLQGEKP